MSSTSDGESFSSRLFGRLSAFYNSVDTFCNQVATYQRPFISSLYLLATNAAFWACVFYVDRLQQYTVLVSLVATLVCLDAFGRVPAVINATREAISNRLRDLKEFHGEHWKQKLKSICIFFITQRPVRMVLYPPVCYLGSWLWDKPVQLTVVCLTSASAHFINERQIEQACWLSYTTVLLVLIAPAWRHNKITESILSALEYGTNTTLDFLNIRVATPLYSVLCAVCVTLDYYLLFRWVPAFIQRLKNGWASLKRLISIKIIHPTVEFLTKLLEILKYYLLGYWIPPLVARIRQFVASCWQRFKESILVPIGNAVTNVVECIVSSVKKVWNGLLYLVLFKWVPPLVEWLKENYFVPFYLRVLAAKNWLTDSAVSTREKVLYCLKRIKDALLYVLLCYWLVDLFKFSKRLTLALANYARTQWLNPSLAYASELKSRLVAWVQDTVLWIKNTVANTVLWIKDTVRDYCIRFVEFVKNLAIRTVENLKYLGRESVKFTKERLLKPLAKNTYIAAFDLMILLYHTALQPFSLYLAVWIKRLKHYVIIQWWDPGIEWIRERLPDKSAFVDDSDTELRDFLPAEALRQDSYAGSDSDGAESRTGFTPSLPISLANSRQLSRRSSDDEHDFMEGLSFGNPLHDSDSSDEEFSLSRRHSARRSNGNRKRNNRPKIQSNIPEETEPRESPVKDRSPPKLIEERRTQQKEDPPKRRTEEKRDSEGPKRRTEEMKDSKRRTEPERTDSEGPKRLTEDSEGPQKRLTEPKQRTEEKKDLLPEPVKTEQNANEPEENANTVVPQIIEDTVANNNNLDEKSPTPEPGAKRMATVRRVGSERRGGVERRGSTSSTSSWSETLLQAYRKSSSKKSISPSKRAKVKVKGDDEFEILDADELDTEY